MCQVGGPIVIETAAPARQWFSAAELAELRLPGLSSSKRKINERAAEERWALRTDRAGLPLSRRKEGRGGGVEYHVAVLPPQASAELARRAIGAPKPAETSQPRDQLWNWFEQQTASVKADAGAKLAALNTVSALEQAGLSRSAAVAQAAAEHGVAGSSIWAWTRLVAGAEAHDWLPRLADQRKGGGREAEVDAGAWTVFLSDYLRPERPTLASVHARVLSEYCAPRGLTLPHPKTLQRKLEREVPHQVVVLKRHGGDALRATIPHQERTVADLHAMEWVNIDGHRWDVFVRWPDGHIARPMMVAIQDIYSRKFLAWRIDTTESATLTRLAFADLLKTWGIPKGCLMDNGRAFASKQITGGQANRFRFKVKPEEPSGLLTELGIQVRWALPFRGSSKPIERGFRDLCDAVAKHPMFAGAYTGNRPDAKPENYASKAIDLDTFKAVVSAGMAAHNARAGRRTEACAGGLSFDEAFARSYATAAIGKAGAEHLRMALLGSERVSTAKDTGEIKTQFGNRYWAPALTRIAGQKVTVRFDPENLHGEVHVYGLDGGFIVTAPVVEKSGFLDASAAQNRARQEGELKRRTRQATELLQLIRMEDLQRLLPAELVEPEPTPEPTVIRPVRASRGGAAAALQPVEAAPAASAPAALSQADRYAAGVARLRLVE